LIPQEFSGLVYVRRIGEQLSINKE